MRALLAVLAMLATFPAAAQLAGPRHVAVTLIAQTRHPAPGRPLTIALTFAPQPGWHTYWKNPGDAGIETRATWMLVGGATAAPLRYPVPGTLLISGLMNYVYEKPATLLTEITVPSDLAPGRAFPVKVALQYLVCTDEQCVPEAATVEAALTIGDGAPDAMATVVIAAARRALPMPLAEPGSYAVAGGRLTLAVPLAGLDRVKSAYFFPAHDGIADYSAPQVVTVAGDRLRLETKASGTPVGTIEGILRVDRAGESLPRGFLILAYPGDVPPGGAAVGAGAAGGGDDGKDGAALGFLPALLLAVVGGIILNVMPCVFSDSQPQGAEPRQGQHRACRRTPRRARLRGRGDAGMRRAGGHDPRVARGGDAGWVGVPAAKPACHPGTAAARHGNRAQPRWPVRGRPAGQRRRPVAGVEAGGRGKFLDRRARRLRRDAVHGAVHGGRAWGGAGAAAGRGARRVRRTGVRAVAAIRGDRLRPRAASPPAPARRVDEQLPPHPQRAHVPHRAGAGVGAGSAGGGVGDDARPWAAR